MLYASLRAPDEDRVVPHALGYRRLLEALRDDRYDVDGAMERDVIRCDDLPILQEA